MNKLLASALFYAERFGWKVIPLHDVRDGRCSCATADCDGNTAKHPRTEHGLSDASSDPAQIRWWWAKWPAANIGILTGTVSGIAGLDVDPRHGGDASLDDLQRIHGRLPDSVEAITGGEDRGRHLYFAIDAPLRGLIGLAPGLDLKAEGGYLIAPPSIHRSGRRYEWEASSRPDTVALAPLPQWVRELRSAQRSAPTNQGGDRIPSGYRHSALASFAGTMRRRGATQAEMYAALSVMAERCDPPMAGSEVEAIAEDFAKYAPADAPQFAVVADEDGADPAWTAPSALRAARDLPTFPTDAFPDWLSEFVQAEAVATQTPVDMAALFALGSLATISGGRAIVQAAPDWTEGTNLFVAVAMEPGSRKSAVERDLKVPILEYERTLAEQEHPKIAELASMRRVAEAKRDRAEKAAAAATPADRFALEREAVAAALDLESIVVPAEPRLFTADATPEALMSLLAAHGGRMAVLSAEGGVFDLMAGRYSNGIPNLDVYLSGHAGDTLRVDRRNRPREVVDRPALTMCLAVQPYVLSKVGRNAEMGGRGLLDRFLYAVPSLNVGFRSTNPPAIPGAVRGRYADRLIALAAALAAYDEPLTLRIDRAAAVALTRWRDELEPRRRPNRDLGAMQGWASKLDGATVRIAGLLHLATGPENVGLPIGGATMEHAVSIARYLIPHAQTAFDLMGTDGPLEDARRILRWIVAGQRTNFTKRECHRAHQAHFERAEDLEPALTLLTEHGWIRLVEDPKRPSRPSTRYQVNPEMYMTKLTEVTKPPSEPTSVTSVSSVMRIPNQTESSDSAEVAMD